MKLTSEAKGVYVIAPTPFHADGRIDEASIDRMTDFFIRAGVDGMTVLGQLGEAPKMAHEESVCLLYTSPSPRDPKTSRMPSSA